MINTKFDWDVIHREWRTGQFSDTELSRRHGCSRQAIIKRRDKEGWLRDLSKDVREFANARMVEEDAKVALDRHEVTGVTGEVTQCNARGRSRDELREIELAAETRVAVLREHRNDLRQMREKEHEYLEKLDTCTVTKVFCHQGEIVSADFNVCDTDKIAALNQLMNIRHKRQLLERKAFNMDDEKDDENEPLVIIHDGSGSHYENNTEE